MVHTSKQRAGKGKKNGAKGTSSPMAVSVEQPEVSTDVDAGGGSPAPAEEEETEEVVEPEGSVVAEDDQDDEDEQQSREDDASEKVDYSDSDDEHMGKRRRRNSDDQRPPALFTVTDQVVSLKNLNPEMLKEWETNRTMLGLKGIPSNRNVSIPQDVQTEIALMLAAAGHTKPGQRDAWMKWNDAKLIFHIRKCNPEGSQAHAREGLSLLAQMKTIFFEQGDFSTMEPYKKYESSVLGMLANNDIKTPAEIDAIEIVTQKELAKVMVKNLGKPSFSDNQAVQYLKSQVLEAPNPTLSKEPLWETMCKIRQEVRGMMEVRSKATRIGWIYVSQSAGGKRQHGRRDDEEEHDRGEREDHRRREEHRKDQERGEREREKYKRREPETDAKRETNIKGDCWGCGKQGHMKHVCKLRDHARFNQESRSWAESTNGKALMAEKGKAFLEA